MGDKAEGDHDSYIRNNSQLQVQEQLHKEDTTREGKAVASRAVAPAEPSARGRSLLPRLFLFTLVTALTAVAIGVCFLYVNQLLREQENAIRHATQELETSIQELETLKQNCSVEGEQNRQILKGKENEIAQITKEFQMLQQNYTEQSKLLDESNHVASIYQRQLDLIKTIGKAIKNMDLCYLQLEKYCSLKAKGNSCNDDELYQMKRLKIYLGCEEEMSADYHLKIKDSFQQYVKNVLVFRKAQVDLMTDGNFDRMAAEQKHTSSVPADTCHFICDLEETDFKSSEDATVFEIGWKVFKAFFT